MGLRTSRGAALFAIATMAATVTACGGGTESDANGLDPAQLESTVANVTPGAASASCPSDVSATEGTKATCTVTGKSGQKAKVEVTVEKGQKVTVRVAH